MKRWLGAVLVAALGLLAPTPSLADTHGAPPEVRSGTARARTKPAFPARFDGLATTMTRELVRSLAQLRGPQRTAPHYLGYWWYEVEQLHVEAKYGSLITSRADTAQFVRNELRVGTMELDNSNYFSVAGAAGFGFGAPIERAPLGDDGIALARTLWLLTDDSYQRALDVLDQKRIERQSSVKRASSADDFSEAILSSVVAPEIEPLPELATLEAAAREASRAFVERGEVHDASVMIDAWRVTRVFVTTGAIRSYEPSRFVRFSVRAYSQAADGMPITHGDSVWGDAETEQYRLVAERVARETEAMRNAPMVTDYSGPVLFEGVSAAQLAYELLGETLCGTPSSDGNESPWLRRLGKRVLPEVVDVYDDPTVDRHRGLELFGGYAFDDEGVTPARVELVQQGRLRALLMSRTPNEHLPHSNGHGRAGVGGWSRGGIGNLIIDSRGGRSQKELRRRLLAQVREEGGTHGIVVQALEQRDYSTMGAAAPRPTRISRLYLDGREEFVRGAEFFELTPRDLKDVLATGRSPEVYTVVQLSSGTIPVAASIAAPALLLEDVEIRRPSWAHELPPVLPRPRLTDGS